MAKAVMLEGIAPVGNTIDRGISMIIYGDPGTGKTTLASTLEVGKTIIINTEAGLGPLLGTGHYVFNLKTDLKQLEQLYQYLRIEKHPFTNVVIDNISELQDWMLRVLYEGRGKDFPDLKEYGETAIKMKEYITLFRDLTTERGFNVVFNAWEMPLEIEKTTGGIVTKIFPKLFKSIAPDVCGKVDAVGHLEVYEKTGDRFIRFKSSPKMLAKCQFTGLDEFEPPNLTDIIAKIRAHDYTIKTDNHDKVAIEEA